MLRKGGLRAVLIYEDAPWVSIVNIARRAKRGQNISVHICAVMIATDENSTFNIVIPLEAVRLACSAAVE